MVTAPLIAGEFEDRYRRHLPRSSDLTLIILKGHLLVEEEINDVISDLLHNPAALAAGKLTCYQRIRLLRALLPKGPINDFFDTVEKLNTLRNGIGHHLDPPQIESRIEAFVRLFEDPEIPIVDFQREPLARRLKRSIGYLCGKMHGIHKGYVAEPTAFA
jgi:hypothetical protein